MTLFSFDTRHARAILWAQWKSLRNHLPRANKGALIFTGLLGVLWYGMFAAMAFGIGTICSESSEVEAVRRALATGFFICFLYWQIVPLLLASKGSSLDLKKLLVYPIPTSEFFLLDVLLRLTIGVEVLMVLAGAFIGLAFNPELPWWAPLAIVPFLLFNMFFAVGTHDLVERLLGRKRVRELVALLFIVAVATPQLVLMRARKEHLERISALTSWIGWPWTAAGEIAGGQFAPAAVAALLGWMGAAYAFGRWQFERTLRFDAAEAGSGGRAARQGASRLEWFYRLPALLFTDPLAALVEKELRSLTRSPRFRLVFIMGFSFGLIIWWPMAFGHANSQHTFLAENYITVVSLYAVLLLSEVLFWNLFGFDRSAAQLYFVVPLRTATVLKGKNTAAALFVMLEVTIAVAVCAAIRLPMTLSKVLEAYGVTAVITLLMIAAGNMTSVYSPRSVDPSKSLRSARSGRVQALILVIYPIAAVPLVLAYGARYAFESELAFYGVLALAAGFGAILYKIALESAVGMAERRKEVILETLSRSQGPIES